jgi:hypothetical protein
MSKRIGFATVLVVLAASTLVAAADVTTTRFDHLKALAGDWAAAGGDGSTAASYRVTANGTAVVETLFPGGSEEMVTVYTVDKGNLVLTHYCAAGNQPHMRAAKGGDAKSIAFKFDGGGNIKSPMDGHMHEATMTFVDADHLTSTWTYYDKGKAESPKQFSLVRKKS